MCIMGTCVKASKTLIQASDSEPAQRVLLEILSIRYSVFDLNEMLS